MDLWLVRHARPLVAPGICYGSMDVEADADHTWECATQLAQQLPDDVQIWTSPQRRCRALCDALSALRPGLNVREDARLREMDFGCWEGVAWEDIRRAALDAWTRDFLHERFGGAENVAQVLQRVASAWRDARSQPSPVLWITHAGVIRAATLIRNGLPATVQARDWPQDAPAFGDWIRWSVSSG